MKGGSDGNHGMEQNLSARWNEDYENLTAFGDRIAYIGMVDGESVASA